MAFSMNTEADKIVSDYLLEEFRNEYEYHLRLPLYRVQGIPSRLIPIAHLVECPSIRVEHPRDAESGCGNYTCEWDVVRCDITCEHGISESFETDAFVTLQDILDGTD